MLTLQIQSQAAARLNRVVYLAYLGTRKIRAPARRLLPACVKVGWFTTKFN